MRSLNFESKNPTIFNMILEIDFVDREIDFNEFISAIS
jgi:Ca2+-binding EF-hand superfamily protein